MNKLHRPSKSNFGDENDQKTTTHEKWTHFHAQLSHCLNKLLTAAVIVRKTKLSRRVTNLLRRAAKQLGRA
jgi:hypothetical protein